MVRIQGKGVSAGIGMGQLRFYCGASEAINKSIAQDADVQWQRFGEAQAVAAKQLGDLAEKARREAGEDAALLFETHQMMIGDEDYEAAVERMIREEKLIAEAAVSCTGEQFAAMFESMDDSYMRSRAADVRDVTNRMIEILCGKSESGMAFDMPVVLAAEDLAPSQTIQLDRTKILGLITVKGSAFSHTAILARALGIPAVVGVGEELGMEYEGHQVIIDGDSGGVIIDPDEKTHKRMLERKEEQLAYQKMLEALKGKQSVTCDGQRIRVCCNIGSVEDVHSVLANDGEGIGLLRSEFLYLNAKDYPSEEEQFEAYKAVLSRMDGREVIIRTCDIGADKQIDYLKLPREENPALGLRALRLSLSRPDVLRTQLRALYRASVYGNLGIMFPMVVSVWEVREVKHLIERVKAELREEGVSYSDAVKIGVMIETPAAAMISDLLACEVDFFSCGTNDLTQYTLACDRYSSLGRFYDPHHLAVLRLIRLVVDNAHKRGVWVGVCGELGADPDMTQTLLAIGVDELSVSPHAVLPVRSAVRCADMRRTRAMILGALDSGEALHL